ncbi:hypothetical protein ACHHYP_11888 [Achlya hypogyna]|uniref:Protein kinase domain-containing protein n=1 Tax=Achlya hypogyna TaxID=1202772 RepID=A0A1V9YI36_ACHHY|nr:hypothetical protein ACHHYP_11888 [Achlya hypogyna]
MGQRRLAKAIHVGEEEIEIQNTSRLGGGDQGVVFRGSFRGRVVAVKMSGDPNTSRKEIDAMQKCSSPYLLPLVAVAEGSNVMLALEFMDGGDLRQYLDKKSRGELVEVEYSTLVVAWIIANAHADMHHEGFVQRDLTIENVFISSMHYIKVGDLGITKECVTNMTAYVGPLSWTHPKCPFPIPSRPTSP